VSKKTYKRLFMANDDQSLKSELEALYPSERSTVMSLLEKVGFDCSEWANYKRPQHPASNPKFCYEWAFFDERQGLVINLWHKNFRVEGQQIVTDLNLRNLARIFGFRGQRTVENRAIRVDVMLQRAVKAKAAVRVIVLEGDIRDLTDSEAERSVVSMRRLDDEPWGISHYDWVTGDCLLARGVVTLPYVDQFSDVTSVTGAPTSKEKTGRVFERSKAARQAVLQRASGRCEYCGEPGFITSSGAVYLETHHIKPLSEGGSDTPSNMAALCPSHHREAHYGANSSTITIKLMGLA
jgi:hypothetical protein